ncbi:MAG: M15 family metallopeptidase [Acidimicrobiia bacterium]
MSRFGMAAAGLAVLLVLIVFLVVNALSDGGIEAAASATTVSVATPAAGAVTSDTTTTTGAEASVVAAAAETTTTKPAISVPTTTATSSTTSTSSTTTTTTTVPTTVAAPPFISSITTPDADDLYASWEPGCPVGPDGLRIITMSHWNYAGSMSTGKLVVAAGLADQVVAIFRDLYDARFPIERMELVDKYNGDDNQSMAANNTSAFNCRLVTGGSTYSEHSYGRAIDINPVVNPYVKGSTVLPPAGSAYVDRSLDAPGMIHAGDEVVQAFAARGWIWGGTWNSLKDYQHFSTTGK